jgi:hypothetical protein
MVKTTQITGTDFGPQGQSSLFANSNLPLGGKMLAFARCIKLGHKGADEAA